MKMIVLMTALIMAIVAVDVCVVIDYLNATRAASLPAMDVVVPDDDQDDIAFEFDQFDLGYDAILSEANGNHKLLREIYDVPGIDSPRLLASQESGLSPSALVVGVEANGQACAFAIDAMYLQDAHIINVVLQGKPISVTYCSLVDCVRVLSGNGKDTIPLKLGGLNEVNEMVLLLCGERYDQSSGQIPLADHRFERISFGEWRRRNPKTLVYSKNSKKKS